MKKQMLTTIGPASLNRETIQRMEKHGVCLFRINLSHTKLKDIEGVIDKIQSWTGVPICLDSEGAQIRNGSMVSEKTVFEDGSKITIHSQPVVGDSNDISFTPNAVFSQLQVGDLIRVDFDSVTLEVTGISDDQISAVVKQGGCVGSNKAADINRHIDLDPVTPKDKAAFEVGLDKGLTNFALSFTNCAADVAKVREVIGEEANLISKIESIRGVLNLDEILPVVDQILIDRGDLSREVPIEKIPFILRSIIAYAKTFDTPVYVATNLLESMVHSSNPTRAEANDVASTLLMGASGLVLAAETAIGAHPVGAVKMIESIIEQYNRWTPETSFEDLLP